MIKTLFFLAITACLSTTIFAEPEEPTGEPDIVITQTDDRIIHEYRINGFVYAVKIIPKNGKPYFLVAEGDGLFVRVDEPRSKSARWELFSWK